MPKPSPQKITNVQALRGYAAFVVFLAHTVGAERDYGGGGQHILPEFLHMGVTGVDLFFLISGFVMVYVTDQRRTQPHDQNIHQEAKNHVGGHGPAAAWTFFIRRALRIYPLYWVVTLSMLALYAGKKILFAEDTPIDNYLASFFLLPDQNFPIIPVGWTLVHEMYFYCIFSIFILFPRRYLIPLLCLWALIVASGYMAGLSEAGAWGRVTFSPLTFEFLVGASIGFLCLRGFMPASKIMFILSILMLIALLIPAAGILYPDAVSSHLRRTVIFVLPYGLLLWAMIGLEWQKGIIAPKWLSQLGDASYALYLIHIPLFLVVGKLLSLINTGPGIMDNIVLVSVYLVSGITVAWFTHLWVENPLLKFFARLYPHLPRPKPSIKA